MPTQQPTTSNIGFISLGVSLYCITLFCIQFFMKHEAQRIIIGLSYSSLILMAITSGCIALTYYYPRLWITDINFCFCHPLWSAALISYISSIFLLKGMYVARMQIISEGSVLGTPTTKKALKIVIWELLITAIMCIALMIFMTNGECHADLEQHGCITTFHVANVYIAEIMIIFDGILFAAFCYKWYKIMEIFKMSEKDNKIPDKVLHTFFIQFILTIIAMGSCLFDVIIHLAINKNGSNYHTTMMIFLFDCTVVATCNFSMISESQAIIRKFICFCCKSNKDRTISPIHTHTKSSSRKALSLAYLSKDRPPITDQPSFISNPPSFNSNQPSINSNSPPTAPAVLPATSPTMKLSVYSITTDTAIDGQSYKQGQDDPVMLISSRSNSYNENLSVPEVGNNRISLTPVSRDSRNELEAMPDLQLKDIPGDHGHKSDNEDYLSDNMSIPPPLSITPTNSAQPMKGDEHEIIDTMRRCEEIDGCVRKESILNAIVSEKK